MVVVVAMLVPRYQGRADQGCQHGELFPERGAGVREGFEFGVEVEGEDCGGCEGVAGVAAGEGGEREVFVEEGGRGGADGGGDEDAVVGGGEGGGGAGEGGQEGGEVRDGGLADGEEVGAETADVGFEDLLEERPVVGGISGGVL